MKFFIPGQPDETKAEQLYQAIRKVAKETMGWEVSDRRIFRLEFYDDKLRKSCRAEVGKSDPITGERVVAILESAVKPPDTCYMVCTPSRGVQRGHPILVGSRDSPWPEDFEK